ncbi:MAG TPA: O-antigen ligase family protein [Nocardioidaceae bacterium]|nr:O-antigen ligase family protein [Nocardioidaceae bacterium]
MTLLAPPAAALEPPVTGPAGEPTTAHLWRAAPLCFAMVTLPLISPAAPGNVSLADLGVAAATGSVLLTATYRQVSLRLPYVVGVGVLLIAGTLAALVAEAAASTTTITLMQDVWMLGFGAAIANAGRDPWVLSRMLRFWVCSATVYAGVVLVGLVTGLNALSGITAANGYRAEFTLGDPNVSGNFFLIALFVLRAMRWPARRAARWPMCLLLLVPVIFSGSNGAMLGLVAGTAIGLLMRLRRERGMLAVIGVAAGTCLVVLAAAPYVNPTALRQRAADSVPLLRDGLGRSNQSTDERQKLWEESTQLWMTGNLVGIGPAETETTLSHLNAEYVKEAHNDYFAALVERGLLGAVGLVLLLATAGLRLSRPAIEGLRRGYDAVVPRPELLISAGVTMAIAALFYETLHFRHLWALLGVAAALDLWGRRS